LPVFLRLHQEFLPDCVGRDLPKDSLQRRYSEVIQWAEDGRSGFAMKPSYVDVKKLAAKKSLNLFKSWAPKMRELRSSSLAPEWDFVRAASVLEM
jgi:hypothetical protein